MYKALVIDIIYISMAKALFFINIVRLQVSALISIYIVC